MAQKRLFCDKFEFLQALRMKILIEKLFDVNFFRMKLKQKGNSLGDRVWQMKGVGSRSGSTKLI